MMHESPSPPNDAGRRHLLAYLRRQLIGPVGGRGEGTEEPPNRRYSMGVLYPAHAGMKEVELEEQPDLLGATTGRESGEDDPIRMATEWFPASVGISFHAPAASPIEVSVWGAAYDQTSNRPRAWTRRAIFEETEPEVHVLRADGGPDTDVLRGAARLNVRRRATGRGELVTISLINKATTDGEGAVDPADCLYQVGFACRPMEGPLLDYPAPSFDAAAEDEMELRLLYRMSRTYAVGHGCAADWRTDKDGEIREVRTEFLPTVDVPPITQAVHGDRQILLLTHLADESMSPTELADELQAFVDGYNEWKIRLESEARGLPRSLVPAAEDVLRRIERAEERMRNGIRVLVADADVLTAFRYAQRVMLMQMRHSAVDLGGSPHRRDAVDPNGISYEGLPYRWYPFQLAFQLLVLESLVDSESPDRDVVDLLWFPTGGGKTEAYLAVAALEIFLRRLRYGDSGGGTAVLTRYTLRLLTTQQFQRSAAMVCAAEQIRRGDDRLGSEPISIGLWVGDDATPNKCEKASEVAEGVLDSPRPRNPFPLQRCPWCGTNIVPDRKGGSDDYGFDHVPCLTFHCPTETCPFHNGLPISIVDEQQYAAPPTFLLATVDKLARLAWLDEPSAFFGTGDRLGPSLVIQDELHLLTGPLGTTFGLYEHAVAAAITMRGRRPKVLASTATIRRAHEQSTALFGRAIELFPPAGLSADDSYFARWDRTRPGRTYAGIMTPAHTVATAVVHAGAALLEGIPAGNLTEEERNAYWTLVIYHNSLRELGRTMTLARDDIPARIVGIARDEARMRRIEDDAVVELTGHVAGWEIPQILDRLERGPDDADAVSVLCSTNMVSVGVDVPRLGLMLVNGQPKQASEYIQATSRVGRSDVPGLVVTLLSAARPRDRSHYEGFVPFHEALYRYVEPTSVTPFSLPSRSRALHAALVIMARHGLGLGGNDGADRLTPAEAAELRTAMLEAVASADPQEREAVEAHVDALLEDWNDRIRQAHDENKRLYYRAPGRQSHALLMDYGAGTGEWATLHSMRNVDRECRIGVLGEDWDTT